MKSSSLILFIASFLLLGACKGSSGGTQSSSAGPNLTGSGKSSCLIGRWPNSSLPLNIKISSDFTGDFIPGDELGGLNLLEQMANGWNGPVTGSIQLITVPFGPAATTGYSSTSSFKDSEIGIYKSQSWFSNVSSSALAITQFYGVVKSSAGLGDYIQLSHADIIVNYDDYGPRMTMTLNPTKTYDVPTIILHEMGHLLGLCHESSSPSVMAPYYLTAQRSLQNFDRDIIQDLYIDSAVAHLSALTNSKSAIKSDLPPAGTEVSGVIELMADGECIHKVNGKELFKHKTTLK